MHKVFICLMACAALWSCSNQKFKVEGRIDGAAGETLYLEHNGILRTTPIDSVTVDKDGSYSLKADRPEYPDFYRLRIKNKTITFAIDSTETIAINGDLPTSLPATRWKIPTHRNKSRSCACPSSTFKTSSPG